MDPGDESHTKIQKRSFSGETTSELDARLAQAELVRQMTALLERFDNTPEYILSSSLKFPIRPGGNRNI